MVLKLEERTLVVVGLADNAGVALAGHGGGNTVKGTTQTQLNTPPLEDTKDCIVRCTGVIVQMGINCFTHNTHKLVCSHILQDITK